jgi:hypothetical protein
MARLTEIEDGSDNEDVRASPNASSSSSKTAGLTQAQQEEILFKSGIIEKLGLPKDFVSMDEAQAQLDALKHGEAGPRVQRVRGGVEQDAEDDSEDDYGVASDHELDGDDNADRLMQEQEATEMSPQVESILDLIIWTMPFGFMYTLLDVLVRQQYGDTVGLADEAVRLTRALPGESRTSQTLQPTRHGMLTQTLPTLASSPLLFSRLTSPRLFHPLQ